MNQRTRDRLLVAGSIAAYVAVVACAAVLLSGCKAGQPLPFGSTPPPPAPETAGERASWGTLTAMSWFAFVPAVGALVASVWIPFLRSAAVVLMLVGLGTAASPWILERYGDAMLWPAAICVGIGMAVSVCVLLFPWLKLKMDAARRVRKLEDDIATESDPEKRWKDMGARAGILRLTDPKVDRAYLNRPIVEKEQ